MLANVFVFRTNCFHCVTTFPAFRAKSMCFRAKSILTTKCP